MLRLQQLACVAALAQLCVVTTPVTAAQQRVMLSDSYLPVAMQVIANLVDQMAYETNDQPTSRPTTTTTGRPTIRPTIRPTTSKPTSSRPQHPWTSTSRPSNQNQGAPWNPGQSGGWSMGIGVPSTPQPESTTQYHKPGLYAPEYPPKPDERLNKPGYILLPVDNDAEEYTVLRPNNHKIGGLLSTQPHSPVRPILAGKPDKEALLPPHFADDEYDVISRSAEDSTLELAEDELNENNLQYVSVDLRDMLKLAHDPKDERAFDINNDGTGRLAQQKPKLSQSNLRLLLLYDLLSREAKRQKLSDFGGFTEAVISEISDAGSGGARGQLGFALAKMVERKDCEHEYANNRAKEMIAELKKDESLLSAETRYLQPLVYKL